MRPARLPANNRIGLDSTLPQTTGRIGHRFYFPLRSGRRFRFHPKPAESVTASISPPKWTPIQISPRTLFLTYNNGENQRLRGFYIIYESAPRIGVERSDPPTAPPIQPAVSINSAHGPSKHTKKPPPYVQYNRGHNAATTAYSRRLSIYMATPSTACHRRTTNSNSAHRTAPRDTNATMNQPRPAYQLDAPNTCAHNQLMPAGMPRTLNSP